MTLVKNAIAKPALCTLATRCLAINRPVTFCQQQLADTLLLQDLQHLQLQHLQHLQHLHDATKHNEHTSISTTTMGCSGHEGESSSVSKLWYVGVILSIIGSIATNMGVNMQKYSFMSEAKRSISKKRGYFRQPLWVFGTLSRHSVIHSCLCGSRALLIFAFAILGLALVVGGSGLDFAALGFLPQSLATPVGGSTMVANVAFASLFLKEKFSRMVHSAASHRQSLDLSPTRCVYRRMHIH